MVSKLSVVKAIPKDQFKCVDCGENVLGKMYMVNNDLWEKFGAGKAMLCLPCLEKRAGRKMAEEDFLNVPVNYENGYKQPKEVTPKERIIEIMKNNSSPVNYPTAYLFDGADLSDAADDIIRYFTEATGYSLETLNGEKEEIV